MSEYIFVRVQRNGKVVTGLDNVRMQIDTMSPMEVAYMGGDAPYMRYDVFAQGAPDVQEGDLLIDNVNLEPRTTPSNTRTKQYRVVSEPEKFGYDHVEIMADRMIGNVP